MQTLRVLAVMHHLSDALGHLGLRRNLKCQPDKAQILQMVRVQSYLYVPSETDIARAWMRSPALVPIPGQSARSPFCGVFVFGRTRVVLDSRIQELLATGPVER